MEVTKKSRTITKVVIELEEWEASDLRHILARIQSKDCIKKSEFSLREKSTGRRLMDAISLRSLK